MSENENITFKTREEQLSVVKKWIQTGEVKIYKETTVKQKNFTVPITREELVIEKKDLTLGLQAEPIRILLSEDQVEFTKHKVSLEDISIYSEQIEDIKHIEATLKHEEAKVNILGSLTSIKVPIEKNF